MFKRLHLLSTPLLLALLLAACGTPNTTPTGNTGGAAPPSSAPSPGTPVPNAPATPTLPAGQKPPRPVPSPAEIAAGAPLRATLLTQLDRYASEVAKCQSVGTPIVSCNVTGFEAVRPSSPELAAYMSWYSFIKQCSSDGKGGYIATLMFVYSSPDELRDPGLLDVYVSGTPWCGQTHPNSSPSAAPSTRPATPNATPTSPSGQRPPRPIPDPAAVAAGAPLRAPLLAQIAAAEQRCAATPTPTSSGCRIGLTGGTNGAELNAYIGWYNSIAQCSSDGKGGYIFTLMLMTFTPEQLRDPGMLDVYVANTPWCGLTGSSTVKPSATPAPRATPTLPPGQRVPPPSPDPAAVAAGAPMRATLLPQIDAYDREVSTCDSSTTDCRRVSLEKLRPTMPELTAYASWFNSVEQCVSDGQGGYRFQAAVKIPTPAELREPWRLDLYVANTPWCGYTGSATPRPSPSPSGTTPRDPAGQTTQIITDAATAKSVTSEGRPNERATDFTVGEEVYITYTAQNVGPGDILDVKLYRNGTPVALQDTQTTFSKTSTYYGYYSYRPVEAGEYRVEYYANGKPIPQQTITFTVR